MLCWITTINVCSVLHLVYLLHFVSYFSLIFYKIMLHYILLVISFHCHESWSSHIGLWLCCLISVWLFYTLSCWFIDLLALLLPTFLLNHFCQCKQKWNIDLCDLLFIVQSLFPASIILMSCASMLMLVVSSFNKSTISPIEPHASWLSEICFSYHDFS